MTSSMARRAIGFVALFIAMTITTVTVTPVHAKTGFDTPSGVAVDQRGNVFVADTGNGRIVVFSPLGRVLRKWPVGCDHLADGSPTGVAVDRQGDVYVSDSSHDCVLKYSTLGRFIAQFGIEGDGEFSSPHGLAIGGRGNVFVANSGKNTVEKLAPDGYVLASWSIVSAADGVPASPLSIAVDAKGTVYTLVCVCDDIAGTGVYSVQKRSSTGELQDQWSPSNFLGGLAVDARGTVFVGNGRDSTIVKLSAAGKVLAAIEAKDLIQPRSIAVDKRGTVYVADADNNVIVKISTSGRELAAWR